MFLTEGNDQVSKPLKNLYQPLPFPPSFLVYFLGDGGMLPLAIRMGLHLLLADLDDPCFFPFVSTLF